MCSRNLPAEKIFGKGAGNGRGFFREEGEMEGEKAILLLVLLLF